MIPAKDAVLILVTGIPGVGKSTLGRQNRIPLIKLLYIDYDTVLPTYSLQKSGSGSNRQTPMPSSASIGGGKLWNPLEYHCWDNVVLRQPRRGLGTIEQGTGEATFFQEYRERTASRSPSEHHLDPPSKEYLMQRMI